MVGPGVRRGSSGARARLRIRGGLPTAQMTRSSIGSELAVLVLHQRQERGTVLEVERAVVAQPVQQVRHTDLSRGPLQEDRVARDLEAPGEGAPVLEGL